MRITAQPCPCWCHSQTNFLLLAPWCSGEVSCTWPSGPSAAAAPPACRHLSPAWRCLHTKHWCQLILKVSLTWSWSGKFLLKRTSLVVAPWRTASIISSTCLAAVGAVRSLTCLQRKDLEGHEISYCSLWTLKGSFWQALITMNVSFCWNLPLLLSAWHLTAITMWPWSSGNLRVPQCLFQPPHSSLHSWDVEKSTHIIFPFTRY